MDAKQLIQEIIQKEGVTPYRIAKDLKVEPSTVYKWQDGDKKPNGEHMVGLLRRAGRLAAMVLIGAIVTFSTQNEALAAPAKSLISLHEHCVLCQIARRRIRATMRAIITHTINWLLPFSPIKQ